MLDSFDLLSVANQYSDSEQSGLKLNIRNEPIREEDPDAQSAFSSVANTLRAVRILLSMVSLHYAHLISASATGSYPSKAYV